MFCKKWQIQLCQKVSIAYTQWWHNAWYWTWYKLKYEVVKYLGRNVQVAGNLTATCFQLNKLNTEIHVNGTCFHFSVYIDSFKNRNSK